MFHRKDKFSETRVRETSARICTVHLSLPTKPFCILHRFSEFYSDYVLTLFVCFSPAPRECPPNAFSCPSGPCLLESWVCDGNPDCEPDGADEKNCRKLCL